MEEIPRFIRTLTGRITICGNLEAFEDLSYDDVMMTKYREYESGMPILNFSKPPQQILNSQFKVTHKQALNDIFIQEKYAKIATTNTGPENRYMDVLGCKHYIDERNSIKLPEYINASYISGPDYPSESNLYIATQGPLPSTIQKFWKMVWVTNSRSIFMLCSPQECQIVRSN